jgi:hypothetical protein
MVVIYSLKQCESLSFLFITTWIMNTIKTQHTVKRDETKFSYIVVSGPPHIIQGRILDNGKSILSGIASSVNQQSGLRNRHFVCSKIYLTHH